MRKRLAAGVVAVDSHGFPRVHATAIRRNRRPGPLPQPLPPRHRARLTRRSVSLPLGRACQGEGQPEHLLRQRERGPARELHPTLGQAEGGLRPKRQTTFGSLRRPAAPDPGAGGGTSPGAALIFGDLPGERWQFPYLFPDRCRRGRGRLRGERGGTLTANGGLAEDHLADLGHGEQGLRGARMAGLRAALAAGSLVGTGRRLGASVGMTGSRGFRGIGRVAVEAGTQLGDLLAQGGEGLGLSVKLGL